MEKELKINTADSLKEKLWIGIPVVLLIGLLSVLIYNHHAEFSWNGFVEGFNEEFLVFFAIGVFAQLVDGTLGMGYGATSTSFLLAYGVPPVVSSTAVHVSEMFTTGASALSHHRFGNINKKLVKHLLIPGVLGSITGAYLLSDVINGDIIKPFIAVYMIILAVIIIRKALKKSIVKKKTKKLGVLAVFGGFMDSVGGGGWGPIVTSTLLGRGRNPRYTIGSVNAAEFAISFASGITFMLFGGIHGWQVIIGLILGGVIAAPLGAYLVNKIKRKPMMVAVGILIILLSLKTLSKLL
ncbi:sulfite exporter TauE/SafE family protein [Flavobacterium reichenbachii]|uniref:Probable membrane transporter protein n=1 Tax=Flavobacterium reichenbachii TaxID=362418 RepID=A0A085ZRB4_9FLAO|nr:sulfite exporter TauE/SafE family protein [Flavobacterium reichenbachii]KFF06978.1 ABC transporter permease [Flavobacterium reichenbachii]OXB12070.1 ABC transporter permease [Flavobacterium reichenbachii]